MNSVNVVGNNEIKNKYSSFTWMNYNTILNQRSTVRVSRKVLEMEFTTKIIIAGRGGN